MPAVTRVFLLRHGAVDPAWEGRIYGALDVPLSELGRREAQRAAQRLSTVPLALVVSSGLARTEYGAELLRAPRGLERLVDPALRELERGVWAGLTLAELERQEPGAFAHWAEAPGARRPPGGESLADLAARVEPALARWIAHAQGADLALVVHGWVVRVIVCRVLGLGLDRAARLDVRTGDLFVLRACGDGSTSLEAFACDRPPPPE